MSKPARSVSLSVRSLSLPLCAQVFPSTAVSIDEFKRLSSLTGRDAEAHAERLKAGMAPDGSMPADERTNPRRGSTMAVALIDRGSLLAQARLEEEAWRGRVEGMVVGTIVGALGGGSAVALHGPLFAAVGAACSVM